MSFDLTRFYLCLVLLFSLSCGLEIKENSRIARLGVGGSRCLSGFDQKIRDFHGGRLSEPETRNFHECMSRAILLFRDYIRGSHPEHYTGKELKEFLENYFLGEGEQIPDDLAEQFMLLKRSLIGGSEKFLTKKELDHVVELLEAFKLSALEIRPYMPLTSNRLLRFNSDQLQTAIDALTSALSRIGQTIRVSAHPYQMADLDQLLKYLGLFIEDEGRGEGYSPRHFREHLPIFTALKAILVSPPQDIIQVDDWPQLLSMAGRWYGFYLQWEHFSQLEGSAFRSDGLGRLDKVIRSAHEMLSDALKRHPVLPASVDPAGLMEEGVDPHNFEALVKSMKEKADSLSGVPTIPFGHFDTLFSAMQTLNYLPERLTADILTHTFRPFIRRLLGGVEETGDGRLAAGLTQAALDRALQSFESWKERQSFLAQIMPDSEQLLRRSQLIETAAAANLESDVVKTYWRELFENSSAWLGTQGPVITFSLVRDPDPLYSFNNLSRANWIRHFLRLLVSGYTREAARTEVPMRGTRVEIHDFYMDAKSLGEALGLFDPMHSRAGVARFREGNLFTPQSNGDLFVNEYEGVALIQLLMSGKSVSRQIQKSLAETCVPHPQLDRFGYPQYPIVCVRNQLIKNFEEYFSNMPLLVKFMHFAKERGGDYWESFTQTLVGMGLSEFTLAGHMDSGDLDTLSQILHYVESVFYKYDANANGIINKAEAEVMFPVFAATLKDISGFTEEADQQSLLFYLLEYGQRPTRMGWSWWLDVHSNHGKVLRLMDEI